MKFFHEEKTKDQICLKELYVNAEKLEKLQVLSIQFVL